MQQVQHHEDRTVRCYRRYPYAFRPFSPKSPVWVCIGQTPYMRAKEAVETVSLLSGVTFHDSCILVTGGHLTFVEIELDDWPTLQAWHHQIWFRKAGYSLTPLSPNPADEDSGRGSRDHEPRFGVTIELALEVPNFQARGAYALREL